MRDYASTAEFIREQFKDLLSDGKAHEIKEIILYANRKAIECDHRGIITHSSVRAAVLPLVRDSSSGYANVRRGIYQEGCYAQPALRADQFDWDTVLDKAMELQELLNEGFNREVPMLHMTPEETQNYASLARSSAESMIRIIDDVAVWMAQIEDHAPELSQEESQSMTMTM